MSTKIELNAESGTVTVPYNTPRTLQLWDKDYRSGIVYHIDNISAFPDKLIAEVVTDSEGYAQVDFRFSENIEIQAEEDVYFFPARSNVISVVVSELPEPVCLKEGEFNYPYLGKDCCPGLYTRWDLRCTKITPPEPTCLKEGEFNYPYLGKDCCPGLYTRWDLRCAKIIDGDDGCVPSWDCERPLNGYENDGCGNRRTNPVCNPTGCIPAWRCEVPANGVETDNCGNRRANPICDPVGDGGDGGGDGGLTEEEKKMLGYGIVGVTALAVLYYITKEK